MEVLQGSVLQSSATLVDAQRRGKQHHHQNAGSSVYASLSLKPHSFPAVSSSWGRRNALAAKIPVVGSRGRKSSRPVIVMASYLTPTVYAEAMMHLGKTQNNLDDIYKDMKNISKYFDDKATMKFFMSAAVRPEQKKDIIDLFEQEYKIGEATKNLLLIMNDSCKLPEMKEIIDQFEVLYFKDNGTVSVTVTSFSELSDSEQEEIAKEVQEFSKAKHVILKVKVDPSVLGGYRAYWGSSMIDNTVKGRLDGILDILKKNPWPPAELEPLPPKPQVPEPVNIEAKVDRSIEAFRKTMEEDLKEAEKLAEVAQEVSLKAMYDNAKPLDALAAIERETAKIRGEWEAKLTKRTDAYLTNAAKKLEEAKAFVAESEKKYEENIKKLSIPPLPGYELPEADGGVREPVTVGAPDSEAAA